MFACQIEEHPIESYLIYALDERFLLAEVNA